MSLLSTAFRLSNSHVDFCLCLGSDAPIMADFGSASATSQGNSVFDDQCDGAIDLTLTEQVVLATFVPLSEAQAQQAAMFPIQLQTQIAGGLSLLPPVGSVESNAQAGAMLVQPSDVSVHCIPLDQGQCRVHIHNLSPPVAEANQMELQAQLSSMLCGTGTACGAGGVAPLAVIPHEVIVSSEIAIPNQDRCVLQDGECRAQLQSMFQVHQQPQVVFTTAVSPPVASPAGGAPPAGGVTEAQAQAQSMLVSMTTRAATPQLAQLALDQVNSCTQQVAGAAGALPGASRERLACPKRATSHCALVSTAWQKRANEAVHCQW